MAPEKMLLLPTLFISFLFLMVPSHCKMDPTSTTPAISQASSTLCGTTPGLLQYRRIQCPKFTKSADSTAVLPSPQNILLGVCVPDETFCSSGVIPDSEYLCGRSGVICKKSEAGRLVSCQFCPAIGLQDWQDTSQTIWETLRQWWLEYGNTILAIVFIISCVGCCLGIWYILAKVFGMIENLLVPHYATPPNFPVMENVHVFSLNELKEITNNFRRMIGLGGFGKVFWGQLSDNRQVAVKRRKIRLGHEKAFRNEVETLSKARHANVIDLIGYCTEKNERSLVYEFMSRKDLYRHIHPGFLQEKSMLFSSWKLRVKVLLDVAKGIEYLHKNAEPRIIQRDIKSKNILIDENWVAKISDFGISVFGPEAGSNYVEIEAASGTAGYLDPDCNAEFNLRATPSNDVYSFGVVMLEVVTGRKALKGLASEMLEVVTACQIPIREMASFIPQWIRSGKLMDVLDKRLPVPVGRELEAVTKVGQLAQQCVMVYHQRPDIGTILTELEGAVALFEGQHQLDIRND